MKSRERACCSPSINTFILGFMTPNMPKQNMNTTKLYFCKVGHNGILQVAQPPCACPQRLLLTQTDLEVLPMGFPSGITNCKRSPMMADWRNIYSLLHTTFQKCSILPFHFMFPMVLLSVFVLSKIRGGCFLFPLSFWSFSEVAALASSSKEYRLPFLPLKSPAGSALFIKLLKSKEIPQHFWFH